MSHLYTSWSHQNMVSEGDRDADVKIIRWVRGKDQKLDRYEEEEGLERCKTWALSQQGSWRRNTLDMAKRHGRWVPRNKSCGRKCIIYWERQESSFFRGPSGSNQIKSLKKIFREETADVGEFGDNGQWSQWTVRRFGYIERVRNKAGLRKEHTFISMSIMWWWLVSYA